MSHRIRQRRRLLLVLTIGAGLAGCDANKAARDGVAEGADAGEGEVRAGGADDARGLEAAKVEPTFDPEGARAFRKQICDRFTAQMVAEHFGVPADELKQISSMGCIYTWSDDATMLEVAVMMPRVHDSVDDAKRWYESATASKTKEEIDAEFEEFAEAVEEHEDLDTKLKKDTAKGLGNMAAAATPKGGVSYAQVDGIGSQARLSSTDGSLWIRTGNLTFQLRAYKGPQKPQVPLDMSNPQAMAKAAVAFDMKWVSETVSEREKAAKKIAPDIVAAFDEAAS